MKNNLTASLLLALTGLVLSCNNAGNEKTSDAAAKDSSATAKGPSKGAYGYDLQFLKSKGINVLELQDKEGTAKVLLTPDYQGRVMTSTADGDTGSSFGWLNYELISSGTKRKQFNPVGGEERFWLGPEGGQYALYFKKGDSFNIAHWQVPALIDTDKYQVLKADASEATFTKAATVTNYAGTRFDLEITRTIRLMDKTALEQKLQTSLPAGVKVVAYESDNQVKNSGNTDWKKEKGLLSIWLLAMLTPTPRTAVIIPFKPVQHVKDYITDNYFGPVPSERLIVKDSVLYFNCDGKSRGKIGLSPKIAKSVAASYDYDRNALTIIYFEVDKDGSYVNSKWELQKEPFKGDVINAYNDGPLQDGTQMGPFYEIESSSSAKELAKGASMRYRQTTCHFQGDYAAMSALALKVLGVELNEAKKLIIH